MKAVILAAGYATRLYPLTKDKPKCLLPVGGKTILDFLCEELQKSRAVEEIIIVTNARFFSLLGAWKEKSSLKVPVRLLNDGTTSNDNRLGAIGDLGFTLKETGRSSDVLMLASDNIFDEGLSHFIDTADREKPAACVAVFDIKDPKLAARKYGVMELDARSQVVRIEEKPEDPKTSLVGMGVYYFSKETLSLVEEYLRNKEAQDAPGYFVRWLLAKIKIKGFVFKGMWYDIGDLNALKEADKIFSRKQA